jgi:hypothetical protein
LGATVAEALKHRLADFRAASCPKDLLAGRPRRISDGREIVVDLTDTHEIVFRPNHPDCPMTKNGEIDWDKVSRIQILSIREAHA